MTQRVISGTGEGVVSFTESYVIRAVRVRVNTPLLNTTLPRSLRYNPTYYLAGHWSLSVCPDTIFQEEWINFQDQVWGNLFVVPVNAQTFVLGLGLPCPPVLDNDGNIVGYNVSYRFRWKLRDGISIAAWID